MTETRTVTTDIIGILAGVDPGSEIERLRAARPDIVRYAQESWEALFEPAEEAGLSRRERELVALRVALLTPDPALAGFHRDRLRALGGTGDDIVSVEIFPACQSLSPREEAILRHVDLVTKDPRAAERADIEALRAAGLDARQVVTLSQLIAFLSFQVRVLAVTRLFAAEGRA